MGRREQLVQDLIAFLRYCQYMEYFPEKASDLADRLIATEEARKVE